MGKSGVYVEGLRETVRNLEKLGADVDDLKDVMGSIASRAADVMQGFTPKVTGKLQASIRGNRAKGKAVVTAGRASVKYAGAVNYGWPKRRIKPRNFTGKTDAVMEKESVQMLEDGLQKLIEQNGLGQ